LDENFDERWISRGGSISWAPRSPDLAPLHFYLWGFIKPKVYTRTVVDIDDFKNIIEEAIKAIKKKHYKMF
jgi:hypothetical protein